MASLIQKCEMWVDGIANYPGRCRNDAEWAVVESRTGAGMKICADCHSKDTRYNPVGASIKWPA